FNTGHRSAKLSTLPLCMKVMETKYTIAFIGNNVKLVEQHLTMFTSSSNRLLVLTAYGLLKEYFSDTCSISNVERIDCAKDGCWEADVIVISSVVEKSIIETISEVATQKIVLYIADNDEQSLSDYYLLKQLLPNSKIIFISNEGEYVISGEDSEILDFISSQSIAHQ